MLLHLLNGVLVQCGWSARKDFSKGVHDIILNSVAADDVIAKRDSKRGILQGCSNDADRQWSR